MSDEISPAALFAAAQTVRKTRREPDALRSKLAWVASLLGALAAPPTEPSLVFHRPAASAAESVAIGAGVIIGRGEGCEIYFEGRHELSRRHFQVRVKGGQFVVEDLGSSNGTVIESVPGRIRRRELRDGDLIRAGGIVFAFLKAV